MCKNQDKNIFEYLNADSFSDQDLRASIIENQNHHLRSISVKESVVSKNEQIAESNRRWFRDHNIRVLNLISSPGSGKTYLLEKTVEKLNTKMKLAFIAGDQEKDFDTQRLKAKGAHVLQLNTMNACHLNAHMIEHELGHFISEKTDLLIIENVGNLVCPAAFDLGENEKIALLSVTEGEDKPSKYPLIFHEASAIVITKTDLIPHLDWDQKLCEEHIRRVNRVAPIFYVSAKTGQGMDQWFSYLEK